MYLYLCIKNVPGFTYLTCVLAPLSGHCSETVAKRAVRYVKRCRCHRSAYPVPFPITVHALTWFRSSLIEHTCNHLSPPFISSLTSVTHRLVLRLQGCMVAAPYTGRCLPVCPSILDLVPAWGNASLQTVDTVHPASRTLFVVTVMLEALPWL